MNDCITPRLSPQEREEREAYFASQKLREQRAEPPELPPSVSLLDLLDQAEAEQRRLFARIATMERELAEARQRDEDATDLILRQGRELAAMRTKAEAAERFSMVVRHRKACLEQGKKWKRSSQWAAAVDAILAACPEKGGAL